MSDYDQSFFTINILKKSTKQQNTYIYDTLKIKSTGQGIHESNSCLSSQEIPYFITLTYYN